MEISCHGAIVAPFRRRGRRRRDRRVARRARPGGARPAGGPGRRRPRRPRPRSTARSRLRGRSRRGSGRGSRRPGRLRRRPASRTRRRPPGAGPPRRSGRSPRPSSGRGGRRRRAPPGSATDGADPAGRGPPRSRSRRRVDVDAGEVHQLERAERDSRRRAAPRRSPRRRGALLEDPQRLDRERPVDPVDDEPRRVGETDGVLPQARTSATARVGGRPRSVASASPPRPARITGAGLKKCRPTTRSGRAVAAAIAATDRALVLVARIDRARPPRRGRGRSSASAPVARAPPRPRRRPRRRARSRIVGARRRASVRRSSRSIESRHRARAERAPASPSRIRSRARSIAAGVHVVEDDLVAGLEGELGDARRP